MKTKKLILTAIIAVILSSCVSTSYYQVYKATPSDKLILKDKALVYEDDNCQVSYNLWEDGGNIGFRFYNKTDKSIYLNLEESFFVLNNISYNYFRNRVITNSSSSATSISKGETASKYVTGFNYLNLLQTNQLTATNAIGLATSSGYSVSYNEEKVVCIPSHTSKIITEYKINQSLFRDCDLYKYPTTNKEIKSKSFTKSESPLVFSNRISYGVGQRDKFINFENEFFVSEITNYPENQISELKNDEFCKEKSLSTSRYFKNVSPDKFFIQYIYNHQYETSFSH